MALAVCGIGKLLIAFLIIFTYLMIIWKNHKVIIYVINVTAVQFHHGLSIQENSNSQTGGGSSIKKQSETAHLQYR